MRALSGTVSYLSPLRYLGVTPPISTSESSEREKEVTATLMEELRRQNTMESGEEARKRCVHLTTSTHLSSSSSIFFSPLTFASGLSYFALIDYDLSVDVAI
jgi:poly(A) polymerase